MGASSSSAAAAAATTVAATAVAVAAVLVKVAVDREKLKDKQRQNYFTNGHWKVSYSHKIDPIWFLLAQFHQRNNVSTPVL